MTAHLRAIGVLMALFLVAALAGAMSGCGGSVARGVINASSLHTPQVTGRAEDTRINLQSTTPSLSGSYRRTLRDTGALADANTMYSPVTTDTGRSTSMASEIAELDAMPVPPGTDPRVFALLKSALKRMMMAGSFKAASAPPSSNLSKVDDLAGTGDTTSATFTWTYRNQGDYNQNQIVNIQDLTPLGQNFGKTPASPDWTTAQLADGNRNNLVGLDDLTPIGANFNKRVSGYHLQYSTDGTTGWAQVADSPWTESAVPGPGGPRVFTHILAPAQAGFYRVLPYDDAAVEGIAGDAVQFPTTTGNPPVAVLTADPVSGDPPLTVDFDGGGSSDPDAGDFIAKYEFDFGDPAGTWVDNGTNSLIQHVYNTAGLYTATLRVTDGNGNTDTDSKQITVGTVANLFTQALTGVTMDPTGLNMSFITEPLNMGGALTNYGFDVATFDDGTNPAFSVPGSRFGSLTSYWHDDHTQLPAWSSGFTDAVDAAGNTETIVKAANDKFFEGANRQTWFAGGPVAGTDYTPAATDPLATAVINLITNQGGAPDNAGITADATDVPTDLQNALSMVLQAADAAATLRTTELTDRVFGPYDATLWKRAYDWGYDMRVPAAGDALGNIDVIGLVLFGLTSTDSWATVTASNMPWIDYINYSQFAQGQINLAHALDQANAVLSSGTITGTFSFDQDTPIGRIVINSGGGDTTYTQGTDDADPNSYYLLICDVDGNDIYNCAAGANASILNPVSICLDLAGNDAYNTLDDPTDGIWNDWRSQQGTGRWGNGILVDFAGNDTYETAQAGQGSGFFGWGLLKDNQGDDTYTGCDFVQGSAYCGVGILWDGGGTDNYSAFASAQGYGDIWGIGLLADKGTNIDSYFAQWDTITAPTDARGYTQGAAAGFIGTTTIPVIYDGGIGAVVDSGGDDTYTAFVRNQGFGSEWSTGILDDRSGNDTYETAAFGQGAASNFGSAIFMDRAGNDKYNPAYATRGFDLGNLTLGAGHNYSSAWFLDGSGDDDYSEQSYGLGTGVLNGWGYFCDMGNGADKYAIPLNADDNLKTLGRGYLDPSTDPDPPLADGDPREGQPTFGLFIDCGGVDTYDANYASIPSGSIGNVAAGDNLGWFRFNYTNDVTNHFRLGETGTGLDGSGIVGFEFP